MQKTMCGWVGRVRASFGYMNCEQARGKDALLAIVVSIALGCVYLSGTAVGEEGFSDATKEFLTSGGKVDSAKVDALETIEAVTQAKSDVFSAQAEIQQQERDERSKFAQLKAHLGNNELGIDGLEKVLGDPDEYPTGDVPRHQSRLGELEKRKDELSSEIRKSGEKIDALQVKSKLLTLLNDKLIQRDRALLALSSPGNPKGVAVPVYQSRSGGPEKRIQRDQALPALSSPGNLPKGVAVPGPGSALSGQGPLGLPSFTKYSSDVLTPNGQFKGNGELWATLNRHDLDELSAMTGNESWWTFKNGQWIPNASEVKGAQKWTLATNEKGQRVWVGEKGVFAGNDKSGSTKDTSELLMALRPIGQSSHGRGIGSDSKKYFTRVFTPGTASDPKAEKDLWVEAKKTDVDAFARQPGNSGGWWSKMGNTWIDHTDNSVKDIPTDATYWAQGMTSDGRMVYKTTGETNGGAPGQRASYLDWQGGPVVNYGRIHDLFQRSPAAEKK